MPKQKTSKRSRLPADPSAASPLIRTDSESEREEEPGSLSVYQFVLEITKEHYKEVESHHELLEKKAQLYLAFLGALGALLSTNAQAVRAVSLKLTGVAYILAGCAFALAVSCLIFATVVVLTSFKVSDYRTWPAAEDLVAAAPEQRQIDAVFSVTLHLGEASVHNLKLNNRTAALLESVFWLIGSAVVFVFLFAAIAVYALPAGAAL